VEGRARSSNHRASIAVLAGILAVVAIPAAIVYVRRTPSLTPIDAGWAIPLAVIFGLGSIALSNLARTRVQWTLGRAGGLGRARAGRILGFIGLCVATSAAISVGFYEVLLRFER
jgi:uncharacterized protein (DUF697 family)